MDDASRNDSPSTTTQTTEDGAPFSPPASRRKRLGKGLSNLLSQPPTVLDASKEGEPVTPVTPVKPDAAISTDAATKAADAVAGQGSNSGSTSATTSAGVVEDAVSLFVEYDERLAALMGRLDATCTLLAQTRTLHQAQQRLIMRSGWMVAAVLAIVSGIILWWAGSTTTWHQTQLAQATRQTDALAGDVGSLRLETVQLQQELTTTRAALSKANAAIDELQRKPKLLDDTGADGRQAQPLARVD
ncbi:MAG: hypothetical protein WD768_07050 [Phycisphaeraceae bacterium]